MTEYKVIILIAVRLKSERLKEKAILELYDEPLIIKLVKRLRNSKSAKEIILCTSTNSNDDKIEHLSKEYGIEVFRGDELDVMSRFIEVGKLKKANAIVRVTGDNPLTDYDLMDQMIHSHKKLCAEYTFTDSIPHGTRSEIVDLNALIRCHGLIQDKNATEYMTWMLNRPDYFRVNRHVFNEKNINRTDVSLTVDTKHDYELVKMIFNYFDGNPGNLDEIINYYDTIPDKYKRTIASEHLIDKKNKINTKFILDE